MKAITQFINAKAQAWALHRQGEDERSVTLNTRRVYILPTHQGIAFGVLLLAMLLASLNYNNSLGLALTFLLGGLAIVAMHHCHHNMVGLTIRFVGVEPVFAGQRAEFRFALEGRGQHERFQFQLYTELAEPGADPQLIYSVIGDVPAAQGSTLILSVPTRRRGTHTLPRISLSTRYPFGLFRAWSWLHMECGALVYPRPAPDAPALPAGAGDTGGRQDEKRGEEDFAGLRGFQEGDSPRHIAWKAYARDEEPRVKQYAGVAVSSAWIDFDALSEPDPEVRLEQLTRQVLDAQAASQPYGLRLPPSVVIAPQLGEAHQERCLAALALCPLSRAQVTNPASDSPPSGGESAALTEATS